MYTHQLFGVAFVMRISHIRCPLTQSFGQMSAKVHNPQIGELLAVRPLKEMLSGLISAFAIQIHDIKNE